jgi:hypothetical protein
LAKGYCFHGCLPLFWCRFLHSQPGSVLPSHKLNVGLLLNI